MVGTSESRFRVACTRVAGMSPAAMLDERAMLDAERALLYTHLSVAEVGYHAGFADPAYFTRFFTRHFGVSPRRFRLAGSEPQ
ncbi:helix-turn-helix domain-containing protein [Sphingomonas sp. T9W2]|uniref:helix-turn-helix domain-containing protein n=1 Tax=Sphingomonas sp. T9W2 TaxID=3143183 RepID=UPI0031F57527